MINARFAYSIYILIQPWTPTHTNIKPMKMKQGHKKMEIVMDKIVVELKLKFK